MSEDTIVPVILCGGSGTRLWPLSVAKKPKQYHTLTGDLSLLADTLVRAASIPHASAPCVICNASHADLTDNELTRAGLSEATLILEPVSRNTAPAVAAAAEFLLRDRNDPLLLILAADHVIADESAFLASVEAAVVAARADYLTTFGIRPDCPETRYGYIRMKSEYGSGQWAEVAEFVEKPDLATAQRYLDSGDYLWNSGMFLFRASAFLDELARYRSDMLSAVRATLADSDLTDAQLALSASFADCPADSIDYAVMEKTERAAVVPLEAGWSDVGSWDAVYELLPKDSNGNCLTGDVITEASRNCLVRADHRKVGIVGLEDIVVVETEDAVLVMSKHESQRLKQLVEQISKKNSKGSS